MKSTDIILNIEGPIYRNYNNDATIKFYNYPATITDGTINGTVAVGSTGAEVEGELLPQKTGNYKFSNVYSGNYTVIAYGPGITTHIIEGMEKYQVPLLSDTTGTDIKYKDGATTSIATEIDAIKTFLNI